MGPEFTLSIKCSLPERSRKPHNGIAKDLRMKEHNHRLAALFRSMADLLSARRANPYRVRAYRRAADALLAIDEDVATLADRKELENIDGIGTDLAKKIEEYLETGTIRAHEELQVPLPTEVRNWTTLPGLSESLVVYLYFRLGIRTLDDLEQLIQSHLLRTLPSFSGSEEQLLHAVHGQIRTRDVSPHHS
jgi:DNA polymerase (family 10)